MVDNKNFQSNEFSDLYIACFLNDIDLVRTLLATSSFEKINSYETNGSTSLHIAVECNHIDIVRLLLHDYGVFRHLTNKQNRTAYDLAQTDAMRQLFRRSTSDSNRFCDATNCSSQFTMCGSNDTNENQASNRVQIQDNFIFARNYHAEQVCPYHDNLIKRFVNKVFSSNPINDTEIIRYSRVLTTIVDDYVKPTNTQYQKAKSLVEDFSKTGKVEPLLRLFTLETPFYTYINQDKQSSDCLSSPIYNGLHSLRLRAFKGQTYRGVAMTSEEIVTYRSAAEKPKRFLVTNTFCSTTRDRTSAQGFAQVREYGPRKQVLMIFNFPKKCLTAIQLDRISDQLPCISEMEHEEEVLILPRTSFLVDSIEQESSVTIMYLEYYCLDQEADEYLTMFAYNMSAYD